MVEFQFHKVTLSTVALDHPVADKKDMKHACKIHQSTRGFLFFSFFTGSKNLSHTMLRKVNFIRLS